MRVPGPDRLLLWTSLTSGALITKETHVNERQLDKNAAKRLAIIRHAREVTGNVALTCRYYGISRQVYYRWSPLSDSVRIRTMPVTARAAKPTAARR